MEQDPRVFVFEKKEIFLIFVFVIIMSITCFTLGVNLGKKLAFEKSGIEQVDVAAVDMKSIDEEDGDLAVELDTLSDDEKNQRLIDESKEKLNQQLKELSREDIPMPKASATTEEDSVTKASHIGKYTIQVGSYNSLEDAKQFAEGFSVRGYNPIINETAIKDKGTWYRVSLGLFDTTAAAREYLKQESTLFQGQEYVIVEIK
jgi:septal ring-binding cell division protein DamX